MVILTCAYVTVVLYIAQQRPTGDKVNSQLSATQYKADLHSCRQRKALQKENNRRAIQHRKDAHNLVRLTKALTHTRKVEARAFLAIGQGFGIQAAVAPLVRAYRRAYRIDADIERSQRTVSFHRVTVVNCKKTVIKP